MDINNHNVTSDDAVENELLSVSECVNVSERFLVVKVGDLIFINIYLPCRGTPDRDLLCKEVRDNVLYWRSEHPSCFCIIDGDFNIDLDCFTSRSYMHDVINSFLTDNNLTRCDLGFTPSVSYTYANESQNYYSKLDYFVSDGVVVTDFDIIDISSNLSYHLPIIVKCLVNSTVVNSIGKNVITLGL